MPTTLTSPSLGQLQRAVVIAQQIEKLQTELKSILGDSAPTTNHTAAAKPAKRGKHTMSAAARAKISAAARARWAKIKGAAAPAPSAAAKPASKANKKRTMSAETRAKLAAAGKRRWEEKKKQQNAKA